MLRAALCARSKKGGGRPWRRISRHLVDQEKTLKRGPEHIKRKLPSMHHQFKALGDIDITKEPMEVGPTTHYIMGGVHVDADTQMSDVPGLFAAGECAAGINGANRLGGNSLSDLLVFGKRAGEFAAKFAKENSHGKIDNDKVDMYAREALKPFENSRGENPYSVQRDLQEAMQHNVGIVRDESEMRSALDHLKTFWERAARVGVTGNRDFNPGWHTALDLKNLLTVSEAITRAALERKESRGAQFREDYPEKDERFAKVNTVIRKAEDGNMEVRLEPLPEMPDYLKQVVEENRKVNGRESMNRYIVKRPPTPCSCFRPLKIWKFITWRANFGKRCIALRNACRRNREIWISQARSDAPLFR